MATKPSPEGLVFSWRVQYTSFELQLVQVNGWSVIVSASPLGMTGQGHGPSEWVGAHLPVAPIGEPCCSKP